MMVECGWIYVSHILGILSSVFEGRFSSQKASFPTEPDFLIVSIDYQDDFHAVEVTRSREGSRLEEWLKE